MSNQGRIDVVYDHILQVRSTLERAIGRRVAEAVINIERGAKLRARVDTGFMRDQIRGSMVGATQGEVGAYAPYSIYHEYGTASIAPQPMLTPAADDERPRLQADLEQIIRNPRP